MDIELLVKLTAKAWSLTILQSLQAGVPGRQAPLLAASGAGRTAFSQSLAHLVELALLARNPGHGHPLRPEFRLTAEGRQAAAMAAAIFEAAPNPADRALLRRRWTVPILAVLPTPRPFGALKQDLTPITDRALSQALKSLEHHRWLKRRIEPDSRPPRALYHATGKGDRIGQALFFVIL